MENIYVFNGKILDVKSIEFDGIDNKDYPDFADIFIVSIDFTNGVSLNDEQLDTLNKNSDLVYALLEAYEKL